MGFVRRFGYFPGQDVISQIEGVTIVDLPPPGQVSGVDVGVVCVVGEFADMRNAVSVSSTGVVSTNCQPVEIFSPKDLIGKVGGFDETIGEFGVSGGNGYAAVRGRKYSRLVIAPVNLASAQGMRFFRKLPVCTSQLDVTPSVPMQGASITAGREFRSGSARVRAGTRIDFTALAVLDAATGGSCASGATAATQVFQAAGGYVWANLVRPDGSLGAKVGDVLVIGYNNAGTIAPTAGGTYRVAVAPTSGDGASITVEALDGQTIPAWVVAPNVPWRLHLGSDADSAPVIQYGATVAGGYTAGAAGGFSVPVRPLTDSAGANTAGSWAGGTVVNPVSVPASVTGSSWDPLSGLEGRVAPVAGLTYAPDVQAPNAAASASLDALYQSAFDATISLSQPSSAINITLPARTSQTIRSYQKTNALNASAQQVGRMTLVSPPLDQVTLSTVAGSTSPGVGATRDERVVYNWPGVQISIPEAVNFRLKTADGLSTTDGVLDVTSNTFMASILSSLPPERNPGQTSAPVPSCMSPVQALQHGAPTLGMNEYIRLKAAGISAPRIDEGAGPIFQSGITSSLTSGQTNISRRRMADYIQDSLARALIHFSKEPLTQVNKDSAFGEAEAFMAGLLSVEDDKAARIKNYVVDDKSGNTPQLEAKGIWVIIVRAQLIPSGDFIVVQTEIGENVFIQKQL